MMMMIMMMGRVVSFFPYSIALLSLPFYFPVSGIVCFLSRYIAHMIKQRQQHGYVFLVLLNNERTSVVVVVVIIVINSISFPFFFGNSFRKRKKEEEAER
jgi:hypothetical protein